MDESQALLGFAALAGEIRLRILRLLVRAGPGGMAAGEIAAQLGVSPSNMSFHLKELERAGMVSPRREARSIIYAADFTTLRGLIEFLTKDCCADRPEVVSIAAPPATSGARKRRQA
jgi:ArsR family transcriptional regulator, arsenate/arsenite/antimonite-responsive transcriptional repressor